jgi:hypothetical protein
MVLTIVYNTESLGLWNLSIIRHLLENTTFQKLYLFPSSDEGRGETDLLSWVQLLRLALSKRPSRVGVTLSSPYLNTEIDSVSEMLFYSIQNDRG